MAAAVREELFIAEEEKQIQRKILDMLNFSATCLEENGEKFIDVSCILGKDRLSASQATCERGRLASRSSLSPGRGFRYECGVSGCHRQQLG